jgi:hypothetical protein
MAWRPGVHHVFVLIGMALLGVGAVWYQFGVYRPQTWPRVEAEVISSRVINPKGPQSFTPELVLRYEVGGSQRQPVLVPDWTSGSYDFVRAHVDRYPAGTRLQVAVNPEDPDDARYEIGATLMNLIGPAIFAFLGVVFGGIGVLSRARHPRAATHPLSTADPLRSRAQFEREVNTAIDGGVKVARRIGLTFAAIGILLLAIGAWVLRSELETRTNWPLVDATVVASQVVAESSGSSSRGRSTLYKNAVTVRYEVDGRSYESTTRTATSTSSRSEAESWAADYQPGSVRQIAIMPGDPNVIRLESDTSADFVASAILLGLGTVFTLLGLALWKFIRPMPRKSLEQIWAEDDEADRFRPRV